MKKEQIPSKSTGKTKAKSGRFQITRRKLLISGGLLGGGLLVGAVGLGGYINAFDRRALQRSALPDGNVKMLSQWITLSPEGHTTLLSPHTEMGQGSHTGLLQIVLDEMDVDPKRATVAQAPASPEFTHSDVMMGFILGEEKMTGWTKKFVEKTFGRACTLGNIQFTGGSSSIRFSGWRGLRRAAAAAREMLAQAGAMYFKVPVGEITTSNSKVLHAKSGRSVDYGQLAQAASLLPVPENPRYKDPSQWKYIGTSFARIDLPDKIFAKVAYGIDVEVPGMRYAAVAPPPVALGTITGISNEADIKARRGVEAVVVMEDAVAVVADNPWRAENAARAAEAIYDEPSGGLLDSETLVEHQRATIDAGGLDTVYQSGDAVAALASGSDVEVEYTAPFLAHAPMEPLNATIWEEGGKVHVATGVQGPLSARASIAKTLGMDMKDVVLHPHTMGGGFGRRNSLAGSSTNWLTHAAMVYKKVGGAVKLTWSREADVRLSTFRPSDVAKLRAKLGTDGKPWRGTRACTQPLACPKKRLPSTTFPTLRWRPPTKTQHFPLPIGEVSTPPPTLFS